MEDQELLRFLLNGSFSHFKKFGQDDYRDPTEKNPSGSLSSKGFYDHRINQSIPLRSYAKDKGISMFDKNSNKVEKNWEESSDDELEEKVMVDERKKRKEPHALEEPNHCI